MKTLLGVLLYRPAYHRLLEQLKKANPGLNIDLVLTNDTGSPLKLCPSVTEAWHSVKVFDEPAELFEAADLRFKRIASWQNALLLYALKEGYDTLIIWEDDQVFFENGNEMGDERPAFFSAQIETLKRNEGIDVCVSRRRGYLHRIPPFICGCIPGDVLKILEQSLCLCNEIVYTGLMTEPGGGFVPNHVPSPYGGVEYFAGRPFIYAGSLAINLHSDFPCFYDVPDIPGNFFSRGNDTFFSLGFDKGIVAREVENTYFHDPYMVTASADNPYDSFATPVDCGAPDNFMNLIKGWFTYSGLLLRLAYPDEWKPRLNEIDAMLKHLPPEYRSIYYVFKEYARRVSRDYSSHAHTLDKWRRKCEEIRSHSPITCQANHWGMGVQHIP